MAVVEVEGQRAAGQLVTGVFPHFGDVAGEALLYGSAMTPDDAHRLLAHTAALGFSASVEDAEIEGTIVRVWLTAGAVLTLSMDTPAVHYLLAQLAEVSE